MVRLARDEWALFYSLIDKITLKPLLNRQKFLFFEIKHDS